MDSDLVRFAGESTVSVAANSLPKLGMVLRCVRQTHISDEL